MEIVDLPLGAVQAPYWNPNQMDQGMRQRLESSIQRFGLVVPLVVRPVGDGRYETIGGAQRLAVIWESGTGTVPCVVMGADDANARLLAQALNRIQGEDELGLRAEMLKEVLEQIPEAEVLKLLPETGQSLNAFAALGQQDLAAR